MSEERGVQSQKMLAAERKVRASWMFARVVHSPFQEEQLVFVRNELNLRPKNKADCKQTTYFANLERFVDTVMWMIVHVEVSFAFVLGQDLI